MSETVLRDTAVTTEYQLGLRCPENRWRKFSHDD